MRYEPIAKLIKYIKIATACKSTTKIKYCRNRNRPKNAEFALESLESPEMGFK
jgi:hypothetical protein